MAKMSKATIMVQLETGRTHSIQFGHDNEQTKLAKDIADGLRAMGYECKVYIDKEIREEY